MDDTHRLIQERIKKLDELKTKGVDPYPPSFKHVNSCHPVRFKGMRRAFSR